MQPRILFLKFRQVIWRVSSSCEIFVAVIPGELQTKEAISKAFGSTIRQWWKMVCAVADSIFLHRVHLREKGVFPWQYPSLPQLRQIYPSDHLAVANASKHFSGVSSSFEISPVFNRPNKSFRFSVLFFTILFWYKCMTKMQWHENC